MTAIPTAPEPGHARDARANPAAARTRIVPGWSQRGAVVLLYYLAVLCGLVLLYGAGDFSTSGFIYQAF